MELTMTSFAIRVWLAGLLALLTGASVCADTIKIAYLDPLSGPVATAGIQFEKHLSFYIDKWNDKGGMSGHTIALTSYDNKNSPQESLVLLREAIENGNRYILTTSSSAVALTLLDAINKWNARNPNREVLLLNLAASSDVTNEKCSFWHFRLDPDGETKTKALTAVLAARRDVKKVYLINPDYTLGHTVSDAARNTLAQLRPDIQIVAEEFVPFMRVTDFAPYIAKIRASGAQAVITGTFSTDLLLLVKAAADASIDVDWYTLYGGQQGAVGIIGQAGNGKLHYVSTWHRNAADTLGPDVIAFERRFKGPNDEYTWEMSRTIFDVLAAAIDKAGSVEVAKVAHALEGISVNTPLGEVAIRADNHQLLAPLFVAILSDKAKYKVDKTAYGFLTERRVDTREVMLPTTCQMQRP
jgi:branched-chain amino acid transport system substrate-binding protein